MDTVKPLFALCALLAFGILPASAQVSPAWRPHVLILGSIEDLPSWIASPASQRGDTGRLREVPTGLKVQLPIVVTDLPPLAEPGLSFDADIEFLGPQGQVLWTRKSCCRKVVRGTPPGRAISLEPVASVQFEPNDTPGIYSVRVTVTDGERTATAVETFRFGEAPGEAGAKRGAINLQMNVPKKNPGVERDVRDCLALAPPSEVIKCSERRK
jgi:hypothetical protein